MDVKDNALHGSIDHSVTTETDTTTAQGWTTRSFSRRSLLSKGAAAGVGVSALGSFLAACGGSASTSGPVTIQYAALQDQTGEQTAEIAKFNQLHAGKIR